MKRLAAALLAGCWITFSCHAQQPPDATATPPLTAPRAHPVSANYEGCVSKLANLEKYVLASSNRCMLLDGNFKAVDVANRNVVLHGLLLEPTGMDPLTLKVDATSALKETCTQTCKLVPPGTRGVHGKEKPGSEGGPAGVKGSPPQPPPQ